MRRLSLLLSLLPAAALAADPPLPPVAPFTGASRRVIRPAGDPWITPAEASGFRRTPSYDETVAWLRKLAAASPRVKLVSIGKSAAGRDIWMAIAAGNTAGAPVVLAQAGIHAGEIDGKDAGLMLLRDLVLGPKTDVLEKATFLFVPMLSPDAHEDVRPWGRINQRGPENAGWRTTAQGLNINRDYTRLDAPETRAILQALQDWKVDLYVDLHVTDGGDYQYDLMYGGAGRHGRSPAVEAWLADSFGVAIDAALKKNGHVPGPLWAGNIRDRLDPSKGYENWPADARLSHNYGDARHLPSILVEDHSLKPYDQRVLSNYVFLEAALRHVGANAAALRQAIETDRARRDDPVVLSWKQRTEPVTMTFLGTTWRTRPSTVSGGTVIEYTGKPETVQVPLFPADVVDRTAPRPKAYWIPAAWSDVIDRVKRHGIRVETLDAPRDVEVEACRLINPQLGKESYEGRVRLDVGGSGGTEPWSRRATAPGAACVMEKRREHLRPGSVRVPTDQPLGTLAVILLEAASQDSFLQWGFFHALLQRTEYVEAYVMEPLAEKLLAEDAKLKAEYEAALAADPKLAGDPAERLNWLYRRTPYADDRYLLYPVFREP